MTETPPRRPALISLDPTTLAEFRRRAARSAPDVTFVELEAIAKPLLGPQWLEELREILAPFKPETVGGKRPAGPLHRTAIRKWRTADAVPSWVSPILPQLPELALARLRARVAAAEAEVAEWRRDMEAVEAQLEDALREAVRAALPRYQEVPERLPPPPRPPTPDREWAPVLPEEVEAAEDIGSLAARVEMGAVEPEPAPRPEHPVLADAWERGWVVAYDFELGRIREVGAAAEAERTAKEKVKARKEARRAADLRRRLAK